MSYPYDNPASSEQNGALTSRSPQQMEFDNLLRRELRVANPQDPEEVAKALLSRYKQTSRAKSLTTEATGIPTVIDTTAVPISEVKTSSDTELQQALDDVERDLQQLTTSSVLKDIIPELRGWAAAIRAAIQEGVAAARFAIDVRQRDKTFSIRRTLGDYARVARLIGALTPELNVGYRNLAQSIDEVNAVLLVMMGEALANIGFNGGRFLFQIPFSEFQARRDAVIYALRNLTGAAEMAYSSDSWPRGINAYRRLLDHLEREGQGDLRSLLVETEIARQMDDLIRRADNGRSEGLRTLGATAQLELERFRRLVITAQSIGTSERGFQSPPLTSFLEALSFFTDGFETAGGSRLLRLARPAILQYGLYGATNSGDIEDRLIKLTLKRGQFAEQIDYFLQRQGYSDGNVKAQVTLDTLLYGLDRAIDLYAVGTEQFGQPEKRALAYGVIFHSHAQKLDGDQTGVPAQDLKEIAGIILDDFRDAGSRLASDGDFSKNDNGDLPTDMDEREEIEKIQNNFGSARTLIEKEICIQATAEQSWKRLVQTMAPDLFVSDAFEEIKTLFDGALQAIKPSRNNVSTSDCSLKKEVLLPPTTDESLGAIAREVDILIDSNEDDSSQFTTL